MKQVVRVAFTLVGIIALAGMAYWFSRPTLPVPVGTCTPPPSGPGWINLLDPEHRDGWRNITDDKDIFALEGEQLHIFGHTVYPLRYVGYERERFGDFELHLEVKVTPGANSGIFLRAQPNDPVYRGFEVQVLEDHGDAPHKNGSGALYDVVTPMYNMALPAGEWNSYDITVIGGEVIVFMNGWRVVHANLDQMTQPLGKFTTPFATLPRDGLLLLQDHGGEVWYRNIWIKKRAS